MNKISTIVALLALCSLTASAALGQATPPPIGDLTKPPVFLYYLVAAVLFAVTVVLSIMPAKRREND